MKQFGILAYPAKHSLSPVIHNVALKALGIDGQYGVFEVDEDGLSDFMDQVKHEPIDGLSVSLPHKEAVMKYLNVVDENARRIGAVNTVVNKGGFLYGYNTDFLGANKVLKEIVGSLNGKNVLVVGNGGAARAIIYGVLKEGGQVAVFGRNGYKAKEIADEFGKMFDVKIASGDLEEMKNFVHREGREKDDGEDSGDILIQATSIWTLNPDMGEEEVEKIFPGEFVGKFEVVMDIVYNPLITPLLKIAGTLGKKVITGDKILLYQAEEQFKLFTEKSPPNGIMDEELKKALG